MRINLVTTLTYSIDRWSFWEPLAQGGGRCSYFDGQDSGCEALAAPPLRQVPPLQRRRLSSLARVVFHTLGQCADTSRQEPVVFSSVMGELQRTHGLLLAIANGEPLSPTAFSLSVHNAIGGLWSLIHQIKAPVVALAPSANSPASALIEAAGILAEGQYPAVNVVFAEADYPEFYQPWLQGPNAPTALAVRLVAASAAGKDIVGLRLQQLDPAPDHTTIDATADAATANANALGDLLVHRKSRVTITEPGSRWLLERTL